MSDTNKGQGGDGVSGVTPAMIEAGAAVIEARSETATQEELASLVYIAMASARAGQGLAQNGGRPSDHLGPLSEQPVLG